MIPSLVWTLPRVRADKYKGGFPLFFEENLVQLLGYPDRILHPFGGRAEIGVRCDIRPAAPSSRGAFRGLRCPDRVVARALRARDGGGVSYARGTEVSVEKSKAELEHLLMRYGATSFVSGWQGTRAVIQFEAHNRRIQFELTTPARDEERFQYHSRGARTPEAALKEWEMETRRVWRSLVLVVKAKLEAVATGISEFEDEFLPYTVIPGADGRPTTVAKFMRPQVDAAYENGPLPAGLLPQLTAGSDE